MNNEKELRRDQFAHTLNYNLAFFNGGMIPLQWILDGIKGNYNFTISQRTGHITCLVIDRMRG